MELLIILFFTLINGILAMSEAAIISSRKARLTQHADMGHNGAKIALELSENPNRFLSTVQIGITLIGILAGAFGGATIAKDFGAQLAQIEFLRPYSDALAVFLVVLLTTYLSLIIGELVPKRIAIQNPERIAGIVAPPMRFLSRIAYPLVWFLSLSTDLMLRVLGIKDNDNNAVTEEEIQVMIGEGTLAGVFDQTEQELVVSVFRLDDISVSAIMTPRRDMAILDVHDTHDDLLNRIHTAQYARYPVSDGTSENIIGVVYASEVLLHIARKSHFNLKALSHPPVFIPESTMAIEALTIFRKHKEEFGFVIGEDGAIEGIITLNDILEVVVGDVDDEPDVVMRHDGSYLIDGAMPIEAFKDMFDIDELPTEDRYTTLAGFITLQLGKIPSAGDSFVWGGYRFEVMDMDGHRVDKILVEEYPES